MFLVKNGFLYVASYYYFCLVVRKIWSETALHPDFKTNIFVGLDFNSTLVIN